MSNSDIKTGERGLPLKRGLVLWPKLFKTIMTEISERSIGFEKIEEWVKKEFPKAKVFVNPDSIFIYKSDWDPVVLTKVSPEEPWRAYQLGYEAKTQDSFETMIEALAYVKGLIRGL